MQEPGISVTSPDYFPRVVKEVMILSGKSRLPAASDIAFSGLVADGVVVNEPSHIKIAVKGAQL